MCYVPQNKEEMLPYSNYVFSFNMAISFQKENLTKENYDKYIL